MAENVIIKKVWDDSHTLFHWVATLNENEVALDSLESSEVEEATSLLSSWAS